MATCTIDLIDFILVVEYPPNSSESLYTHLETLIWKNQWLSFNHVLFALLKGSGSSDRTSKAMGFVQHLLLGSNEFKRRAAKWNSLNFSPRHWVEEDFHEKLMVYLQEFPEYHEFEGHAMHKFEQTIPDIKLQTKLPIYFTNVISDFTSTLETLITRLVEYSQNDLLANILDTYGHLFKYHPCPLSVITNLLLYYNTSETLQLPRIRKRILRLLGKTTSPPPKKKFFPKLTLFSIRF
jgi:hypothetical protein